MCGSIALFLIFLLFKKKKKQKNLSNFYSSIRAILYFTLSHFQCILCLFGYMYSRKFLMFTSTKSHSQVASNSQNSIPVFVRTFDCLSPFIMTNSKSFSKSQTIHLKTMQLFKFYACFKKFFRFSFFAFTTIHLRYCLK